MHLSIGIDMGGTNIKGVLLDSKGNILSQKSHKTEDKAGAEVPAWQKHIRDLVQALKEEAGAPVQGIGISAPGLANETNRAIAFMPGRLEGLENFDWPTYLEEENVRVLNDAHSALLAEHHFGAGKGYQHIVLLTLGTGVGGGVLINGELYQGIIGRAGHLGHIAMDTEDLELDICNTPGSLESALGNVTIQRRTHGRYSSTAALVKAYQEGDGFASYVWLTSVRKLALGLVSLINSFSPEVVLLGGGITLAGDSLFKPLAQFMDVYEWRPGGVQTPIRQTHFQEWTGAVGAACFVMPRD